MDQRVRTAIALMEHNLQRTLSVKEIVQTVHLSPSRFRQLFKRDTGTSLGRYIRELRTQRAKELLEVSFLSVKEIAAQVGIGDVSHFAKSFEKAYGLTPTQYRTRCRTASRTKGRTVRQTTGNRQIG